MLINNTLNNTIFNPNASNVRDPIYILERLPDTLFEDCVLRQFLDFNTYFPLCLVSKNWNKKLKQKIHRAALHWNARDLDLRYIQYLTIWEFLKRTNNLQVDAIKKRTKEFNSLTHLFFSKICQAKYIEFSNEMGLSRFNKKMVFHLPHITNFLDLSKKLLSLTLYPYTLNLFDISKHLPQSLQHLTICSFSDYPFQGIDDQIISTIGKSCPNLEQLSLTPNRNESSITDFGLNSLADSCPKITHLRFVNINFDLCRNGFYNIGIKCIGIKSLHIELNRGAISKFYEAICKLPQISNSLQEIIIYSFYEMRVESVQTFQEANLPQFTLSFGKNSISLLKKAKTF